MAGTCEAQTVQVTQRVRIYKAGLNGSTVKAIPCSGKNLDGEEEVHREYPRMMAPVF